MEQKLIEGIMAGLTTIAVSIVGYLVTYLKEYLNNKTALLEQQLGQEKYNHLKFIAQEVFYIVEEQYKGCAGMANAKRMLFDQLLLSKIPGLKQEELDHLRQSVVGEINSQIK